MEKMYIRYQNICARKQYEVKTEFLIIDMLGPLMKMMFNANTQIETLK